MEQCKACGGPIRKYAEGTTDGPVGLEGVDLVFKDPSAQPVPQIPYAPQPLMQSDYKEEPVQAQQPNNSYAPEEKVDEQSVPATPEEPMMETEETPGQKKQVVFNDVYGEGLKSLQDMMAGHIKPKTYSDLFHNKELPGKIGTIFGLMLSGAGSGLTGQPNMLLEMMNKEIDRDFEGQKNSAVNAQNFLRLHQQHRMNEAQIDKMVKEGKLTMAQADLAKAEADIKAHAGARIEANNATLAKWVELTKTLPPTDQRRINAESMLRALFPMINSENIDIANKAASAAALFGQGNQPSQDPEEAFKNQTRAYRMGGLKDLAEDMEAKHVPGTVGVATRKIPEKTQEEIVGHQVLDRGLNDLINFAKTHSTIVPGTADYNKGVTLARDLQAKVRESVLNTVYREGEQPILDQFVKTNPAGLDKWLKTIPQLETLKSINQKDYGTKLKNFGLKPAASAQSSEAQGDIVKMNGKPFRPQKGPDGKLYYVPVKK